MGPLTSSGEMEEWEEVCLVANNRFDSITILLPENKVKVPHSLSAHWTLTQVNMKIDPPLNFQVIKLQVSLHR